MKTRSRAVTVLAACCCGSCRRDRRLNRRASARHREARRAAGAAQAGARRAARRPRARQRRGRHEDRLRAADQEHRASRGPIPPSGATKSCAPRSISSSPTPAGAGGRPARKLAIADAEIETRGQADAGADADRSQFEKALAARNMSVEQLRTDARIDLTIDKMMEAEVATTRRRDRARGEGLLRQESRQVQAGRASAPATSWSWPKRRPTRRRRRRRGPRSTAC